MSLVSSNRLLPLLAGTVLILTVFVAVKSCSNDPEQEPTLSSVPQPPPPDADTPADTIKTLTANVSAMTAELNALRHDNTTLTQENRKLVEDRDQIESSVLARVQQSLEAKPGYATPAETQSALAKLTAKVDALNQKLGTPLATPAGSDIPVGIGLDHVATAAPQTMVWLPPAEQQQTSGADGGKNSLVDRLGQAGQSRIDRIRPEVDALLEKGAGAMPVPVFTVPRNATLIGATGMTALVGRVPIQGQVRDPMPFKILTGKDNLAANGLHIPGIEGMIWSGTAIGDWTLSCVTGTLNSVTFVFEDGTIQSVSSDDRQNGGSSGTRQRSLGWISDARGIPCVTGDRKTNAPAFLAQRMGVMALEAAGDAAAQSETTTLINDAGGATTVLSGQTGQYMLGKTLSGGSDEVGRWLRERQAQSFDAVFVPAGIELAIHVDQELPIDFHHHGRKLHHETSLFPRAPTPPLSGLD